ncbi:MAG: hypothetical protein EZS28_014423 [Streblomastix strix]|uniref:Thioesterase putative domain-containing protein n=1 Tax=Streblomastix strix TaxID=222440 RepID=A0A5J4W545_9EUKA|nr:MAG: hypothetical protein EZS28_014423 [Streblomastix strix]
MNNSVEAMRIANIEIQNEEQCIFCNVWIPIEPITNQHGSAFGGSIYSLALITGWSLISAELSDHLAVIQEANIKYKRPVIGPFLLAKCIVQRSSEEYSNILKLKNEKIKGKVNIEIKVYSVKAVIQDVNESTAEAEAIMTAKFHAAPCAFH